MLRSRSKLGRTRTRFADLVCAASMKAHRVDASSKACPGFERATLTAGDADASGAVAGRALLEEEAMDEVEVEEFWRDVRLAIDFGAGGGFVGGVMGVVVDDADGGGVTFGQ